MIYRLHAVSVNFVFKGRKNYYLELGKQYDSKWVEFNNRWFGLEKDGGIIEYPVLEDFYNELVFINGKGGEYQLYNLEGLKEMIDYAVKNKLTLYFVSY